MSKGIAIILYSLIAGLIEPEVKMQENNYADVLPEVSPDGKKVAFFSTRKNNTLKMYVFNFENGEIQGLFDNDTLVNYKATWSPDSKRIAFSRRENGFYQIAICDSDGSHLKLLTNENANSRNPSWSKNGRYIAYQSDRDDNSEIYIYDFSSGKSNRITYSKATDSNPDFGPAGNISFQSNQEGLFAIYVANTDGSNATRITPTDIDYEEPEWSPDGDKIGIGIKVNGKYDIAVMKKDGSKMINLSNYDGFDFMTSWMPDSKRIVFSSSRNGNPRLYIKDMNDGTQPGLLF